MPTRIVLDQPPAARSRLTSPRGNSPINITGFYHKRWVTAQDEQEQEEEKEEETTLSRRGAPSPMMSEAMMDDSEGGGDGSWPSAAASAGENPDAPANNKQKQKQKGATKRRKRRASQTTRPPPPAPINTRDDSYSSNASPGRLHSSRRATSISGFRSSLLRELSVRTDSPGEGQVETAAAAAAAAAEPIRLSSDDIRASSRFLGYLFCMIASAVLLVSVIQFQRGYDIVLVDIGGDEFFMTSSGFLIYRWKLIAAIYVGAVGVGSSFLIILAHFDTFCLPRTWLHIFRDGSRGERNLIFALLFFWVGGLHVCTSSLSVGEVQANVYFTSWIAFGSIVLNYGVWREAAGLSSLADKVNMHHRETTYNWMWIGAFSLVVAGAATDMYFNRADIELRFRGNVLQLRDGGWIIVVAIVWAEVGVCVMAILLNEWFVDSWKLPCSVERASGTYRCVFGWRQLEGLVMLAGVTAKVWVILEYTGVDGVINGLSNAYFGIWGSFFNSVFALGTWLRENKNIEYCVKEEPIDRDSR